MCLNHPFSTYKKCSRKCVLFLIYIFFLLFLQAKHLCLELARSVIMERRPLPLVFRAIDVLVKSFAYSLKTGSYTKGGKLEKTPDSSVPEKSEAGKSVKNESASGFESRTAHDSGFSTSDSEDNSSSIKKAKAKSHTISSSGGNTEEASRIGDQLVNQPLNVNISEQQESQVTSAAISPDELYSFVFASVEEEMIADASYLFAIIVEFIRR